MLTKDSINLLVHGFLHDACSHLGIDDSQINISYMPMPVPMMLVMLLKDTDDIVIDTSILAKIAEKNTYSILRNDIYRTAREIYQRRKHKAEGTHVDKEVDAIDAYAFTYALSFLNGLSFIIPKLMIDKLQPKILQILNEEFHEDCILHSTPDWQFKDEFIYRIKKTKKAHKEELRLLKTAKPLIISTNVANGEKGSATNPFDNVLEACRFIEEEERKAFDQDIYMSNTLSQRRFNYCADINIYNINGLMLNLHIAILRCLPMFL